MKHHMMMSATPKALLLGLAMSLPYLLTAQSGSNVLFTLEEEEVTAEEFAHIYAKTNGPAASFTLASLSEYLELYKKFKMKVRRAREMQLDTLPSLRQELAGYRKQLAANYLIDREVTNQLVREAWERSRKDVRFSHILVKLESNPSPEDTLRGWKKIHEARKALASQDFESVVAAFSEDETTVDNGGDLGYFTALFPNEFYDLETAVYTTSIGSVSNPVRTRLGYHLVRVSDIRDARGEVEAAHILIRPTASDANIARVRIDSIYQALRGGADFAELAKSLSEDRVSASKGGNIGVFGINRYEKPFEDAAFSLKEAGDYSMPIQTTSGWHIVKLIRHIEPEAFDVAARRLEPRIKRDARFEGARAAMVEVIKADIGVTEHEAAINAYAATQNDTLFTFFWKPSSHPVREKALFTLGKDYAVTAARFEDFLQKNSAMRTNMKRTHSFREGFRELLDEFIKDACIQYEEDRLEEKYPEFKALMKEYEEGILLFEATKRMVWDKASQDSIGLEAYFSEHLRDKYKWGKRARVSFYQLKSMDEDLLESVRKYAGSRSSDKVLKKFNKSEPPILSVRELIYEHGKNMALDQMVWEPGSLSYNEKDGRIQGWTFLKIEEVLPPKSKTLDEARGYAIADYQDKLEQDWVRELASQYKVRVNQSVLQSLVKK
jgi:peptidyl-prolyl cis-trans isomerase SurA